MSARLFLTAASMAVSVSCGAPPFEDYASYEAAPRTGRTDAVSHYLALAGIEDPSPFLLGVIDTTITDPISGSALAGVVRDDDFDSFMKTAVPVVYYSLRAETYAARPPELASLVDSFIVDRTLLMWEDLGGCTTLMRLMMRGDLASGGNPFTVDGADLSLPADSAYSQTAVRELILNSYCVDIIAARLTLADFLAAPPLAQQRMINVVMLMKGIHGGIADEDLDAYMTSVEALVAEWQYESTYYLRNTAVGMLPPETPVLGFVDTFVTCAMERYE